MAAPIDLSFDAVADRFRAAAGLGPTDKAVADALGVTAAAYSNRKRNNSPHYAEIIVYAAAHGLDLNALFVGGAHEADAATPTPTPAPPGMIRVTDAETLMAAAVRAALSAATART